MRLRFLSTSFLSAWALLAAACDSGGAAPCVLDTDCADFRLVCIDERCQLPGAQPEAGTGSDAGPRADGGGGMDAGEASDAGPPSDGGESDGGDAAMPGDGGPPMDAPMPCSDPTGAYAVSLIITAPCGSAMVGYTANVTAGAGTCQYTIASTDMTATPAADGAFTLDGSDALVPAESSIDVGGAGAASCTGSLSGDTLTFSCGSCVIQLAR